MTFQLPARRLVLAGGFAVLIAAAPAAVLLSQPADGVPVADCPAGESVDTFTGVCVPHLVPNSPAPFSSIPGNPDIPAVNGIPCTGANTGECIGLAEEQQAQGPQPSP